MQLSSKGDKERQAGGSVRGDIAIGSQKQMLFALWASMPGMCLDFIDVFRVHLCAKARRRVYVELSQEDHEEGKCGH